MIDIQVLGECQILSPNLKVKSGADCFRSPCIDKSFNRKSSSKQTHAGYFLLLTTVIYCLFVLGYQFCMAGMSVDWSLADEESEMVMGLPGTLVYSGNLVATRKSEVTANSWFGTSDFDSSPETWIAQPANNANPSDTVCDNVDIYNRSTGLQCNEYTGTTLITAQLMPNEQKYIAGGLNTAEVKLYSKTPFNT